MPIILPNPDEIIHVPTGTILRWRCPKCHCSGSLEDGFGLRWMNRPQVIEFGVEPEWRKQSYCYHCRFAYFDINYPVLNQPSLFPITTDELEDEFDENPPDEDYPIDNPPYYFEDIA